MDIALDEIVFFVRKNKCLPLTKRAECIDQVDFDNLVMLGFTEDTTEYQYYMDDGYSRDYENPANIKTLIFERK